MLSFFKRWWLLLLAGFLFWDAALLWWWWQNRLEHSQDGPIQAAARKYGVEPALVKAVVWRESGFKPRVVGRAEEIGLMQLQEGTAFEWAEAERVRNFDPKMLFDPGINTQAGTWYLRKLLRRYAHTDNPVPYALADYNAGRANVLHWLKGPAQTNSEAFLSQITFPGTQKYVIAIMEKRRQYRRVFH